MIDYIMDNMSTIIISAVLFGLLALIIYKQVTRSLKGGGCGCGPECNGCKVGNPCQCGDKIVNIE